MGRLTAALTDRARVVRVVAAGGRVEGRTRTSEIRSEWVAARLILIDQREREDNHGQRQTVQRGQIVVAGGDLDVTAADRIEVRSPLLGDGTWRVVADPLRAVSRRASRALVLAVERVAEPVRDEVGT